MKKTVLFIILFLLFAPTTYAIEEVATVPNEEISIQLDLFDYDILDSLSNHPDHVDNTQFNQYTPLKFYGVGENESEIPDPPYVSNPDRYTKSDAVRQGMVEQLLNPEGFPVLSNTHEDLNVLFDYNAKPYKHIYQNVKNLFVKRSAGFYYFDSNDYYAEYDYTNNTMKLLTPTFKLKNSLQSPDSDLLYTGFFPFDHYDPAKTDVNPKESLPNPYLGYNHHFGMHLKTRIYLPEDLEIEGQEMKFDFTGDDDIWIFIDGVLVLDLGGLHHPATGSINLTTGTAYTEKVYDGTEEGHELTVTIDEIFRSVGKQFDWDKNSEHTMDIFYLERGGVFSNLKINTNFWQPQPEPEPQDPVDPEPQDPDPEPEKPDPHTGGETKEEPENPETKADNFVKALTVSIACVFVIILYIVDNKIKI